MRVACLQHVPFEGPAAIGTWAATRGVRVSVTHLFANEHPPALETIDLLVILGGPMSANDEAQLEWLRSEKQFIQQALMHNKRVLGICLGAQLLASVLGARVYPHTEREVGWFPVRRTPESDEHPGFAALPNRFTAFHWHGETFDLPEGATWLAQSDACPHQAFSVGKRILGLQFHLESTPESVEALIQNCPGDLAPGRHVQDAPALLSVHQRFRESNRWVEVLLDRFVSGN